MPGCDSTLDVAAARLATEAPAKRLTTRDPRNPRRVRRIMRSIGGRAGHPRRIASAFYASRCDLFESPALIDNLFIRRRLRAALVLCAACVSIVSVHAAPAAPSSASNDAPAANTGASSVSSASAVFPQLGLDVKETRTVTLSQLGLLQDVALNAPETVREFYLPVPADIPISDATLQLDGGYVRGDGGRVTMLLSLDG